MSFHKLDKARDKNFWSVRVSADIRLIVHKTSESLLLCYVYHHDKAYAWAERRKLETHPKTGAAQLVEIRETVKEIVTPVYVQTMLALETKPPASKKPIFAGTPDDELLGYGVPTEWLDNVKKATEDTLLVLADHLPGEAAEALLELATGGKPRILQPVIDAVNPFDHPDSQRRFRVMTNMEELQRALDFPWEKWIVFLHPEQKQLVEHEFGGPARVSGSAGTGKTIVALHRAVHFARLNSESRVLLTTFTDTLANALQTKLKRLLGNDPRLAERIDVYSLRAITRRLYKVHIGPVVIADREIIRSLMQESASAISGHKFSLHFLLTEWERVVDAWQLNSWEAALGHGSPNALFFAGDLGQRIFQQPFSWKSLGVDIRGRSSTLRVNYRTSHQIRTQADRLLGPIMTDVDGNSEDRSDAVSVFNGPPPTICSFKTETEEIQAIGKWIIELTSAGLLPHEFGVFVRSAAQLDRARAAGKESGLAFKVLDEHVETTHGHVSISTMHLAKGLEFRAVVVMACDDEIIPLQERIETIGDDADLQEVYNTERHLLYVACTRARDNLLVTSVEPASEFLDDMRERKK